ncbi:hypothetical protein KEM56_006648 [Ascosphaera pollenicola]|nr:hypothetical protein KEM56_006648 [Ascosphaera pollenicola]
MYMFGSILVSIIILLISLVHAEKWALDKDISPSNFMQHFHLDASPDQSGGMVQYTADTSYLHFDGGVARFDVEQTPNLSGRNRKSIRLRSNFQAIPPIMIIADVEHIPADCGTWPAFWMTGNKWPDDGELDILESTNGSPKNKIALHLASHGECHGGACDQPNLCMSYPPSGSFGKAFNSVNGGLVITAWTKDYIKIWQIPHNSSTYNSITSNYGSPNPGEWEKPVADYAGCDYSKWMKNQKIIINTDFGGDMAKADWRHHCSSHTSLSMKQYVLQAPDGFNDSHWSFRGIKIYKGK